MLDAHEIARRIKLAMDGHKPPIKSARIAALCGVTPQAVNGWRKTGRVAKRHLAVISRETERPLQFFLEDGAPTQAPLQIEESEAIARLRTALPQWRNYVLSLAMIGRNEQELLLHTMQQTVPDYVVERAYGRAPHVAEKQGDDKKKRVT